jgi:curved DNA-binding protein
MLTHYQILGLAQEANTEQIKRRYRSLVKRFHPDLFPSGALEQAEAEVRLREIIAAYAVLSNAGKRASYDAKLRKRTSSAEEPKPEYCRRCGRPTLYWQIGRDAALCDGCEKPMYV